MDATKEITPRTRRMKQAMAHKGSIYEVTDPELRSQLSYYRKRDVPQESNDVSKFYGILVRMFPSEGSTARIFAYYDGKVGAFDIQQGAMFDGNLPHRAQLFVEEWMAEHKDELIDMWSTQKVTPLPPLK